MQAGRKPKPTKLKLIEGNPGKRPLNLNEPKPNPNIPECPDWLLDDAKEEWKRMSVTLQKLGMLTFIDKAAFMGYCQAYAKWKKAEEFIKQHGFTYKFPKKDKEGNVISIYIAPFPEVGIARAALEQVRQFCSEFGLTPSSRTRLSMKPDSEDEEPMAKVWNKYKKRA